MWLSAALWLTMVSKLLEVYYVFRDIIADKVLEEYNSVLTTTNHKGCHRTVETTQQILTTGVF